MLTTYTSREQRVADLEIHGWEPVFNNSSDRHGIYNEQIGTGFSVRPGDSEDFEVHIVKRWDRDHMRQSYTECAWDRVTDWHLDAIDARLAKE